jgi:hypothetical protein
MHSFWWRHFECRHFGDDILNVNILSCDILNVDILSCDILNVDILSCDILNVDILSCDILNVNILSCDILNVDILSCDILNVDILLCDILGLDKKTLYHCFSQECENNSISWIGFKGSKPFNHVVRCLCCEKGFPAGLPDGFFSKPKSKFGQILEGP